MKDSSRWLLAIAIVALTVAISGSGWSFNLFSLGHGSMSWFSIMFIALALWCILGKGCRNGFGCGNRDESEDSTKD
jgi:hypothetical protein